MNKPKVIVAIRLNKPKVEITTGTLYSFAKWAIRQQDNAKNYTIHPAYTLEAIKAVKEAELTAILLNKQVKFQINCDTSDE